LKIHTSIEYNLLMETYLSSLQSKASPFSHCLLLFYEDKDVKSQLRTLLFSSLSCRNRNPWPFDFIMSKLLH